MSFSIPAACHDVLFSMTDNYMQNIIHKEKNYEFRRYDLTPSIQRIWFFLEAPFSHIAYICEIDPPRTRNLGDPPLPENGVGNAEFNAIRDGEWEGYDYAYRVRSVWRIRQPIPMDDMEANYGLKLGPHGFLCIPESLMLDVPWNEQECVWSEAEPELETLTGSLSMPLETSTRCVDESAGKESAVQTIGTKKMKEKIEEPEVLDI